jgi:hypothetical protein
MFFGAILAAILSGSIAGVQARTITYARVKVAPATARCHGRLSKRVVPRQSAWPPGNRKCRSRPRLTDLTLAGLFRSACPKIPFMAAITHRMTVAEFRRLPEDTGPVHHELCHGELVAVTRPKLKHALLRY